MPMPYYRNTNYSLIYALLAVVVICALTILGPLVIEPAMNDLAGKAALQEFEAAFDEQVQHPAGTQRLVLRSEVGAFTANGQGCDFFIGEVRSFQGSGQGLLAAYVGQTVKDTPLQVGFIEQGQIPLSMNASMPEALSDLAAWDLPPDAEQQLYIVTLLVLGVTGDGQLDCRQGNKEDR